MATTNDPNSPLATLGSLSNDTVPAAVPYPPSPVKARCYYYGLPSRPLLVARSSANVWVEPRGPEAYLLPKELGPMGSHPLREIWETVGQSMVDYLDSKGVKFTSLDLVRIGYPGEPSPPIVWMGVVPGSLSAKDGIEVATHCKSILSTHNIDDVHVEIRESLVIRYAGPKMHKPTHTSNTTARAREPFSTALGLPICAEITPSIEGTGGFFISDPRNPGKVFLVTARHVVFPPDKDSNELYQRCSSSQRRRNVLLLGDAATEKHITAIKSEINSKHIIIEQLESRLEDAEQMDEEDAKAERNQILPQLEEAREALKALEKLRADVSRERKEKENRVLGYVALSPPIGLDSREGFMEDWAVIEIDDPKVDLTNFAGNVIDLGTTIPIDEFTAWMLPHPANPPSFKYPGNRLLELYGTISDEEMWKPSPSTLDNDPCITVIKRGDAPGLTVGRLNTIRSFTRVYFEGQPGQISKEVAVLPRNSKSGAFSWPGDSGSAVVDGKSRFAGLLTGGAGDTEASDCTYLTSINFLLKRMLKHGLKANLSLSIKT